MGNKKLITSILTIIVGTALLIASYVIEGDNYWPTLGGAVLVVGIAHFAKALKYKKDASYRESIDIQEKDERNRYISMKAWAWSGYIFVFLSAAALIAFKLTGYDTLSMFCATAGGLLLTFYVILYLVLSKKY